MVYAQVYWEVHLNKYSLITDDIINLGALQMLIENVNPVLIGDENIKEINKYINRYVPKYFLDSMES
jgi:hypothetical protein